MVSKFEGDSGSVAYSFTVRRTGMIASSTVNWAVAGDTGTPAVASDFVGGVLPSGVLLVKCFKDMGFSQIVEKFRAEFKVVVQKKPKASRDKSSETFLVGLGLKPL